MGRGGLKERVMWDRGFGERIKCGLGGKKWWGLNWWGSWWREWEKRNCFG